MSTKQRAGRAFRLTNPEALAGLEEVKAGLNRLGFPASNADALTYGVNIARAVLSGQLVRAEDAEAKMIKHVVTEIAAVLYAVSGKHWLVTHASNGYYSLTPRDDESAPTVEVRAAPEAVDRVVQTRVHLN